MYVYRLSMFILRPSSPKCHKSTNLLLVVLTCMLTSSIMTDRPCVLGQQVKQMFIYLLHRRLHSNHVVTTTQTFLWTHYRQRSDQGCLIFLGPKIPNGKKYTKRLQTIPNGHKLYEMAVKYSIWS
jgi:hypothetical protein